MVISIMLATFTDPRDFDDDWLLERKLDGERCVARKVGSDVRLESRTGKDLTSTYPEVRAAVAAQRSRDLLLDGEVVAYEGDQTSFTRIQQRLGATRPSPAQVAMYPVVYCVFDPLEVDGRDLTDRPRRRSHQQLSRPTCGWNGWKKTTNDGSPTHADSHGDDRFEGGCPSHCAALSICR